MNEVDAAITNRRDVRQVQVQNWGRAAFGDAHVTSVPQRCLRLIEEAIEACQAGGLERGQLHRLVDYIYSRPVGELHQEIGGIGVTLLALAAAASLSADAEEVREIARILSKPTEHFMARNQAKNDAGFNVVEE